MLCILLGQRQDEYCQFSIDPEEKYTMEWDNGRFSWHSPISEQTSHKWVVICPADRFVKKWVNYEWIKGADAVLHITTGVMVLSFNSTGTLKLQSK
jgi:hypothetical protein